MKNSFLKNVVKLSSGTSLAHLITILISPFLSRLFTPSQFGELQLFQSSLIIATFFSTGCYHYALVIPKEEKEAIHVFNGIIRITISISILFFLILLGINNYSGFLETSTLFIWVFPITLFLNALIVSFDHLYIRNDKYTAISYSRISRTSSTALIQSVTGFFKLNHGLIIGLSLGRLVTVIFYLITAGKQKIRNILSISLVDAILALKKYRKQPLFILPSSLVSMGSTEIVIFLIAAFFGGYELGLYSLAYRVLSVPSSFIGSAVGEVFFKRTTVLINQSKSIRTITFKTWISLFLISVVPCTILYLYGTEFVVLTFGLPWEVTGKIAEILSPLILLNFISSPTGKLFISLNDQKYTLILSAIIFISRIGGLYLGYQSNQFIQAISYMVAFHMFALVLYNVVLYARLQIYEKSIQT